MMKVKLNQIIPGVRIKNHNLTENKVYDVIKTITVFEGRDIEKFVIINDIGEELAFNKYNNLHIDVTDEIRNEIIDEILN